MAPQEKLLALWKGENSSCVILSRSYFLLSGTLVLLGVEETLYPTFIYINFYTELIATIYFYYIC